MGTYITGAGYLEDVPWDAMPIESFVATGAFTAEWATPPAAILTEVNLEFYWDGKNEQMIFENDAKVKVQLNLLMTQTT